MARLEPLGFLGADTGDLRQALAAQGSDSSFLDAAPAQRQQPAPVPTAPAVNPLDQALELSGSTYRLPSAAPVAAPAPAPVAPPPISAQAFDPSAGLKQLRGEQVAGVNEKMDLATQKGEIGAESATRQAEQHGLQRDEQRAGIDSAKSRQAANDERRARLERQADEALEAMSDAIKNPPDATKGKALSIVGSILSMLPGGQTIGQGFQMLQQSMAEDMNAYALKIQSNKEAAGTFAKMAGAEDDENESLLRQQQLIGNMTAATYDSALKQIESEAKSDEERRAAQEARLGVRQIAVQGAVSASEQRAAFAAKKARTNAQSAADTEIIKAIVGAPSPEAGKAIAAQYGPHGLELLGLAQKGDVTQAGLEGKRADTEATRAKLAAGPAPKSLTDGERKTLRLFAGVAPSVSRIREMAGGRGAPHPYADNAPDILRSAEALEDEAALKNVALALLRDESGAALPPAEQAEKRASWGVDSGDPDVRKRGLQLMLAEFDARNGMLTGEGAAPAPAPLAPPSARDPRFTPGRVTPQASQRGVTPAAPRPAPLGAQQQLVNAPYALPDVQVNVTPEELAGIPSEWLRR